MKLVCALLAALSAAAATHEIGPGKAYKSVEQAPWAALEPGDTVLIHWRAEPYRAKWVICRAGTEEAPITVRGVPGPDGSLPLVLGEDAKTGVGLNYWNEPRSILKIGGANVPADTTPRYVVIENLEIAGARPPYTFTDRYGGEQTYADNAAAVHIEKGEHITIRNCVLRDSGNGLFIGPGSGNAITRDILVEHNHIFGNGLENNIYVHNSYTEALGITFQYNHYGPLRAGAGGNNLKDRSAGLIVRYNWIESGNRQLDLVDTGSEAIAGDPQYRTTFVYGNVLVEPEGAGNRQIVHYGGDSGETGYYRKGALLFYHNTVFSTRPDRTTLFRLSTNDERCEARNNIVYVRAAGRTLALLDASGALDWGRNWIKPGWVPTFDRLAGTLNNSGTSLEGDSPGFADEAAQDFRLTPDSPCIDAGEAMPFPINEQYVKHTAGKSRPDDGKPDLGAFETNDGLAYASTASIRCGPRAAIAASNCAMKSSAVAARVPGTPWAWASWIQSSGGRVRSIMLFAAGPTGAPARRSSISRMR